MDLFSLSPAWHFPAIDDENDDEGSDEEEVAAPGGEGTGAVAKKKKKKKKNKKKKAATAEGADALTGLTETPSGTPASASKPAVPAAPTPTSQTDPPTVPVRLLFPGGKYPEGEWQSYKDDNRWRETSAEKREMERLQWDQINEVRQAAEVHRQVRRYIKAQVAKPPAYTTRSPSAHGWGLRCQCHPQPPV